MILTKRFRLIYNYENVVCNNEYEIACNPGSETKIIDSFYKSYESDNLSDIELFIVQNNLIVNTNENFIEPTPFIKPWDTNYPDARVRLFMKSLDGNKLTLEQLDFVVYLKQNNINLIVDEEYNGVWAYLEYILPEHKIFLEQQYNAKFEER